MQAALDIVRRLAREEGCFYERTASEYRKDDTGHVWGCQTWTGANGKAITVTICKQ